MVGQDWQHSGVADDGVIAVAVVGTGSAGTKHLGALRRIKNVQAIAVPKRRDRTGELAGMCSATARDLEEATGMGATLCIIASETGQHLQDGRSALENGCHVLVEKPLAQDAAQAKRLCEAAEAAGRRVFVGCVLRFSDSLNLFQTLLPKIGRPHSVRIECQSFLPDWRPGRRYQESYSARLTEGGVLLDLIHEIDYAGWFFGWPSALHARLRNLGRLGIAAEETADLLWETADACLVSISLDYLCRPPRRRVIASGELGSLDWDGISGIVSLALAGQPVTVRRSYQTHDEMVLAQDRTFIEASCGKYDPRLVTGEVGLRALAVCDSARRATKTGHEERVDYTWLSGRDC